MKTSSSGIENRTHIQFPPHLKEIKEKLGNKIREKLVAVRNGMKGIMLYFRNNGGNAHTTKIANKINVELTGVRPLEKEVFTNYVGGKTAIFNKIQPTPQAAAAEGKATLHSPKVAEKQVQAVKKQIFMPEIVPTPAPKKAPTVEPKTAATIVTKQNENKNPAPDPKFTDENIPGKNVFPGIRPSKNETGISNKIVLKPLIKSNMPSPRAPFSYYTPTLRRIVPTSINQIEKTTLSEESHKAMPTKAYIYSPFLNEDVIKKMDIKAIADSLDQAIETNLPRVLKDKESYPVLFNGPMKDIKNVFQAFKNSKEKKIDCYLIKLNNILSSDKILLTSKERSNFHNQITRLRGQLLVLEKMTFVPFSQANTSKLEKIYLIGHGAAGKPNIYSPSDLGLQKKSVEEIATELNRIVEPVKNRVSIHILSCHSADREVATSFNEQTLQNNIVTRKNEMPLAQHLAKAIGKWQDEKEFRVVGYSGAGVIEGPHGDHKIRMLEGDFKKGNCQYIRASGLKTAFTANNPPERLPGKEPFSSNR